MPFSAQIYRVMIASPSDVSEACEIARLAIEQWNAAHSIDRKAVLLPVTWETASAPALGNRAQAVINDQLGICDILIGVFWTRLGTPTGTSASGTVEEIDRHIAEGSLVMLYFSNQPASPDSVDPDQLKAVNQAKEKYKKQGLVNFFETNSQLHTNIGQGLSIHMNKLIGLNAIEVFSTPDAAPSLGTFAKEILREAARDSSGQVMKLTTIGRRFIQTNGRNMISSVDPREVAKWEEALEELVDDGLLAPIGYKGEIFKVTAEGYRIADTL